MPYQKMTEFQEDQIRQLYRSGKTGPHIAVQLNVSLKQIYTSLKRQGIPRKTLWEQNKLLFASKPTTFYLKENISASERELLIAAVMLYYGEGAKTGVTVDFANADPRAAKLFLKFLRTICHVDETKLRLYLYCFSDQKVDSLIRFWSSQLSVEQTQFTKPHIRSTLNRGKKVMPYGVIHVRYSDKKLLEKILSLCVDLIETI